MLCLTIFPLAGFCCVVQDAYQARLMFGDALMSAVNMGQMLHAAENTEDADKLKSKVCCTGAAHACWQGTCCLTTSIPCHDKTRL